MKRVIMEVLAGVGIVVVLGVLLYRCIREEHVLYIDDDQEESVYDESVISSAEASVSTEEAKKIYQDTYDRVVQQSNLNEIDLLQNIVDAFGGDGFAAVDEDNQINMVCAEQIEDFCKKVAAKESARVTLSVIRATDGFLYDELVSKQGEVTVTTHNFVYNGGHFTNEDTKSYQAYNWQYTAEGYLLFQEYHMSGYDGPSGHTAIRVAPLEEQLRVWNRQYILPIGYGLNNMFTIDWDESDYGELNFYDLFDKLYSMVNGTEVPYKPDDDLTKGARYQLDEAVFEEVIMPYFQIGQSELQSKTDYDAESKTYEYRPRGFEDSEIPEVPYPEVVRGVENADGTLTLTVNAVYEWHDNTKLFSHEVTVRPISDSTFQYVSNQMLGGDLENDHQWHEPRLTKQQWEDIYLHEN